MARIRFDRKGCDGFFVCSGGDSEDFEELRGERKVDLIGGTQTAPDVWEKGVPDEGEQFQAAKEAAVGCPVDAIQLMGDDGSVLAGPEKLPVESNVAGEAPKPEPEETPA